MDAAGQFLFAIERQDPGVLVYSVDAGTGALSPIAGSPFAVNPNAEGDLVVDPSGKYLYMTIGFGPPSAFDIFNIDPNTGALTPNANSPVPGSEEPMSLTVAQFAQGR